MAVRIKTATLPDSHTNFHSIMTSRLRSHTTRNLIVPVRSLRSLTAFLVLALWSRDMSSINEKEDDTYKHEPEDK